MQYLTVEQFEAIAAPLQKSHGFALLTGGRQIESTAVEKRDYHIRKRKSRFLGYWQELQKDFTLPLAPKRQIIYYSGYAPTFELSAKSILLRGWLGAGKTQAVLRSLLPHKDKQVLWVTGRNGLLRQTEKRAQQLGFTKIHHFQDNPGLYQEMLRDGHPGIYCLCPDSLKDYAVKHVDWSKFIVVIDEFSGVRREILQKSAIIPESERLMKECHTLIAVDAFLSAVDARVIAQYRGKERSIYDQHFAKSSKKIMWLETRTKDGKLSLSHEGIYYPLLKQWVETGKRIVIVTDSKLIAKLCHAYVESLGGKIAIFSSETIETNQVALPDPDQYLNLNGIEHLVCTPTAQSGVDIQTDFDQGLAIYAGVISPLDFMQLMGRARQCHEWHVSAARRSIHQSYSALSLDNPKVKAWGEKLGQTYQDLGIDQGNKTTGWALWQTLTGDIEKSFPSEYLQLLLGTFYQVVETVETGTDRALWKTESQRIKRQETRQRLSANLQTGQQLLREQKAPSTDAQGWDVLLAAEDEKYPAIWKMLQSSYLAATGEEEEAEVINLARLFLNHRMERLKHWVSATGTHAVADLAELGRQLRQRFTSYHSPNFKRYQNHWLFRELNLEQFAATRQDKQVAADAIYYRVTSPQVGRRWQQFQSTTKLKSLFPTCESQEQLWALIKRCMAFFGYQMVTKNIRVATPGELHPNGKDRHRNQRFCESAVLHFTGWLLMAESGSKRFQANFALIIQAITAHLDVERLRRAETRAWATDPPLAA